MTKLQMKVFLSTAIAATLFLSGCVGLAKSYPEVRTYTLAITPASANATSDSAKVLLIRPFDASPGVTAGNFLLRRSEIEVEEDYYNRFVRRPEELIRQQLATVMAPTPELQVVKTGPTLADPDYLMEGTLVKLEGDFSGEPVAVMELQLSLFSKSTGEVPQLHKYYLESQPLDGKSPDQLVEGWNRCLDKIADRWRSDVRAHMQSSVAATGAR